jgi:molecular chaperone GrpE
VTDPEMMDPLDQELAQVIADDAAAAAAPDTESASAEAEGVLGVDDALAAISADRDQFKDIALRLQADFENYRKRMVGQQADDIDRATGRLVDGLLPVLDACEAAFAHGTTGVEPIWSALLGALQKQGLEVMDLQGKPFDPTHADAVVHEPGDEAEPIVAEVLRTGYRWKGRVLRAAMVKVQG